ncbi:hypothetical protein CN526_16475 [Bacillus wiedmannii]|uniref:hypothetical protein n=1 Tax=Bacillus wiedmannii TaxID=1890302 RepID=UPI000BF05221|nr:hypothetical protein [Bacillus wiedmannii]PEO16421.1 hypothetical protein CN562_05720 [Bacillus wiedmannii]PEQ03297.1 hypothetical protein CN587_18425 [Bacillus wiedmannii]PEU26500.1 hypothetical protein CN526_16475 [Bacillus wiedmannii]
MFGQNKEKDFINRQFTDVSIEKNWIKQFAKWLIDDLGDDEKVLEICAGRGILGNELENRGVPIVITDNGTWKTEHERSQTWEDCEEDLIDSEDQIGAKEAIIRSNVLGEKIKYLLMGWPPGDDDTAYEAMKLFSELFPGQRIIFIGTTVCKENPKIASKAFYKHFKRLDDEEKLEQDSIIQSFKENVVNKYKKFDIFGEDEVQLGIFEPCGEEYCINRCEKNSLSESELDEYRDNLGLGHYSHNEDDELV